MIHLYADRLASLQPGPLSRFCPAVDALIVPPFNYGAYQPINNEMNPLVYCVRGRAASLRFASFRFVALENSNRPVKDPLR